VSRQAAAVVLAAAVTSAASAVGGWLVAREETARARIAMEAARYDAFRCESLWGKRGVPEGPAPRPPVAVVGD